MSRTVFRIAMYIVWICAAACDQDTGEPAFMDPYAATPVTGQSGGRESAPGVSGTSATMKSGDAAHGTGGSNMPVAGAGSHAPKPTDAGTQGGTGGAGAMAEEWAPGDYPPDIMEQTYLEIAGVPGQADLVREYKVHVPPSYDANVPAPVVFCIHGLTQDAVLFCVYGSAMHTKSDEAGFVLIMPNGYENSWNAGVCCGAASEERIDDVALFRAILDEVDEHLNLDRNRVYATGFSNGGFMSYRLACEAADIFTAVAPGAGAIGTNEIGAGSEGSFLFNLESDFTACEPSRPVSVLEMHGTEDFLVPYDLQAPTLALLATKNGCAETTQPAAQPASGGDTTCVSYDGCPNGIELTACTVKDGGHCWFGSPDCGTAAAELGSAIVGNNSDTMRSNDAAWDFFKRLSR